MPSPVVWDELRRLSQGNWPVTAAEAIIGPPRRGPRQQPTTRLTSDDIKGPVASLRDITATLAAADPAEKAKVYAEMGIDVTYHQDGRSSSNHDLVELSLVSEERSGTPGVSASVAMFSRVAAGGVRSR